MGTARKRTRLLVLSVAATILGLSDRALAFDAHLDIDRFGVVPDSRTTFFVRVPTVGADLPVWGIGGALLYTPSLLRYRQYPQIGDREQALVEHRVEVDPYFFWYPVREADQSLVFSVMLPIVINSGAQSGSFAAGDLVELDADEGFTLGDLQLSLFYSYSPVETLVGGIGLDLRLPTGVFRPASLATDNLVRIFPRIQLGWTPVEWLQVVLEAGDQITVPGYEEGPLTGPLTTEGQEFLSETVGNLAISFLLPKRWFISFETSYWFNTQKIASPQEDYARQLQLVLSFGSTFDVGPGDLQFHLGGRYNPLPARREVGATHGGALLRMDYVPRDRCEAPSLGVNPSERWSGDDNEEGCVTFTAVATSGDRSDWTIVTVGEDLRLTGRNLGPLKSDGRLTLVPAGGPVSDPTVLDLTGAVTVNSAGSAGETLTVSAKDLAGVRTGPWHVEADSGCPPPAQQSLLMCPRIEVSAVPREMRIKHTDRFVGRFNLGPGLGLSVTSEALKRSFNVLSDETGFTLGEELLLPMGEYDLEVRASGADWVEHCPGARVTLKLTDESKCCDSLLADAGLGPFPENDRGSPGAVITKAGECRFETRMYFAVGQDDTVITNPWWTHGSGQSGCTLGGEPAKPEECEAMLQHGCTQCSSNGATLASFRSVMRWAASLSDPSGARWTVPPAVSATAKLDIAGQASLIATASRAAVPPDGWNGSSATLIDNSTKLLAIRRAERMQDILCSDADLDGASIASLLSKQLPSVRPVAPPSATGPCAGVELISSFEPKSCPSCENTHKKGEPAFLPWEVLAGFVKDQNVTATFTVKLPRQ